MWVSVSFQVILARGSVRVMVRTPRRGPVTGRGLSPGVFSVGASSPRGVVSRGVIS